MSDDQSNAVLVLGSWQSYAARDWSDQACLVQIGSQTPHTRTGSYALNYPVWLLPACFRHLNRHGVTVQAGSVVTTGSWVGCLQLSLACVSASTLRAWAIWRRDCSRTADWAARF